MNNSYGINWNDNDQQPDEHIFKITFLGNDSNGNPQFSINNTAYTDHALLAYYVNNAGSHEVLDQANSNTLITHVRTENNENIYNIKSVYLTDNNNDKVGLLYARQSHYNKNYHGGYGNAYVYTTHPDSMSYGETDVEIKPTREEWMFEFI